MAKESLSEQILKRVGLWALLLVALMLCGILVMWAITSLLALESLSVVSTGIKVGLVAWIALAVWRTIRAFRKKKE